MQQSTVLILFVTVFSFFLGFIIKDKDFPALLYGLISIAVILFLALLIFYYSDYRQGQIDSLTGKIRYELVTKPDSTKVWQEIKQTK